MAGGLTANCCYNHGQNAHAPSVLDPRDKQSFWEASKKWDAARSRVAKLIKLWPERDR